MVLKTIALTGASGMLGSHIAAALVAAGVTTVRISRGEAGAPPGTRTWDLAQWRSDAELDEVFASAEAVIHAGAAVPSARRQYSERELFDTNVRAVFNLASWAGRRGVPLVHISGAIVYANPGQAGIAEDAELGWNGIGGTYGLTKLLAERVLQEEKARGLKLAIVRPSSIYGYGLGKEKMICSFLARAEKGDVEIREPVDDSVDLIHASDVAGAVLQILERGAWQTFNLASGSCTSIRELAAACVSVVGKGRVTVTGNSEADRNAQRRFDLNTDAARLTLGWTPRTDLASGLRSIAEGNVTKWVVA